MGARSGPSASGIYPRTVSNLGATPAGIQKAGSRELMEALRRPGQVRYPPSVATDFQLGFSVAAYQSAEVPFDRRSGDGRILVSRGISRTGPQARSKRRHDPTGEGGLLPLLRPPQQCGGAVALPGRVALRAQGTWNPIVGGTRPLGRSLRPWSGICARLMRRVLHMGLGRSIPGAEASCVI